MSGGGGPARPPAGAAGPGPNPRRHAPLTFRPARAILPGPMRRALLSFIAAALCATGLAGCGNACEDLGARLCTCSGGGTATDTCKQQIKNLLSDVGLTGGQKDYCSRMLDTCNAPSGADFCEWINTSPGKVACGLAYPTTPTAPLQSTP